MTVLGKKLVCQMGFKHTKNANFGIHILEGLVLDNFGIF
jgi:hypothetical protein